MLTVITPTTGRNSLQNTIASIKNQKSSVPIRHLILWDNKREGDFFSLDANLQTKDPRMLECDEGTYSCNCIVIKDNCIQGKAAGSVLRSIGLMAANTEWVTFMDDDVIWDSNHVDTMLKAVEGSEWGFCKRRIWTTNEGGYEYLGVDEFESVGEDAKTPYKMVDNNCMMFRLKYGIFAACIYRNTKNYNDDKLMYNFLMKNAGDPAKSNLATINQVCPDRLIKFFRKNCNKEEGTNSQKIDIFKQLENTQLISYKYLDADTEIKLHLGCGTKRLPGFIHVDLRPNVQPDIVADISNLSMFEDNSVDLLYFCHGLEHISPYKVLSTLKEWQRVLKPGGVLRLSMPDFETLAKIYVNHNVPLELIVAAIHGGQDYPENTHYWSWDFQSLSKILQKAGFINVRRYNAEEVNLSGYEDFSTYKIANCLISLNVEAIKKLGQLEPEGEAYEQALAIEPDSVAVHNNLGYTFSEALKLAVEHHRAHRLDQAQEIYNQILERQPQHPDALYGLGVLTQQTGQYQTAEKFLRALLRVQPESVKGWFSLGNLRQVQDLLPEAVEAYQQALSIEPDSVAVHNNLGYAWQLQGKWEEAITCYQKALELQPDCAEAEANLGNALYAQGKLSPEKQALYAGLNYNLGVACQKAGDLKTAVAYYRQALSLKPNAEVYNKLGNVLQQQGKLDEAVESYQQALRLKPDPGIYNNLGNALQERGQLDEAECR